MTSIAPQDKQDLQVDDAGAEPAERDVQASDSGMIGTRPKSRLLGSDTSARGAPAAPGSEDRDGDRRARRSRSIGGGLKREHVLIGLAGMIIAGLIGGATVASTVRSEDKARARTKPVPTVAMIHPGREHSAINTPAGALMELWSSAQWGDLQIISRLQDPVLRATVGDEILTGVYKHQRSRLVVLKPRLVSVEVDGATATLRYRVEGDPSILPQLAIMRRCGRSWCMRYDTFIEDAIPYAVAAGAGAGAGAAGATATAGARAAAKYRVQAARLVARPLIKKPSRRPIGKGPAAAAPSRGSQPTNLTPGGKTTPSTGTTSPSSG